MSSHRVIRGHDGPVEIDPGKRTVTKTYVDPDPDVAARKAAREAEHLARLSGALAHVEGVTSPRLLRWDSAPPPRVVMTLCPGEPLAGLLERYDRRDARIAEIAARIRAGLDAYVGEFREPHYDFCFENLLYDESSGNLTLLDFGIPAGVVATVRGKTVEASLGTLIGAACYNLARPLRLFSSKAAYFAVLQAVLAGYSDRISRRRVCVLAHATFDRLASPGSAARRAYYRTAGRIVARLCLSRLDLRPPGASDGGAGGH